MEKSWKFLLIILQELCMGGGGVQYIEGSLEYIGGYLEYIGKLSGVHWEAIRSTLGSHPEYIGGSAIRSTLEGYHDCL